MSNLIVILNVLVVLGMVISAILTLASLSNIRFMIVATSARVMAVSGPKLCAMRPSLSV